MTKNEIDKLIEQEYASQQTRPELIETHISWVLIGEHYVYKVKKPITYSFLVFSTSQKRKYYCEREIILNKRLTEDIYLEVVPVVVHSGCYAIEQREGDIIDFAVKMRKVDRKRQMDVLLTEETLLFIYYKSYRANVRAKVNRLRASSATDNTIKKGCLAQTARYLRLMEHYISRLV